MKMQLFSVFLDLPVLILHFQLILKKDALISVLNDDLDVAYFLYFFLQKRNSRMQFFMLKEEKNCDKLVTSLGEEETGPGAFFLLGKRKAKQRRVNLS